jgi:hypothetical protein
VVGWSVLFAFLIVVERGDGRQKIASKAPHEAQAKNLAEESTEAEARSLRRRICKARATTPAEESNTSMVEGIIFTRTLRCGTGYRQRHSATVSRVVVTRIILTRSG